MFAIKIFLIYKKKETLNHSFKKNSFKTKWNKIAKYKLSDLFIYLKTNIKLKSFIRDKIIKNKQYEKA